MRFGCRNQKTHFLVADCCVPVCFLVWRFFSFNQNIWRCSRPFRPEQAIWFTNRNFFFICRRSTRSESVSRRSLVCEIFFVCGWICAEFGIVQLDPLLSSVQKRDHFTCYVTIGFDRTTVPIFKGGSPLESELPERWLTAARPPEIVFRLPFDFFAFPNVKGQRWRRDKNFFVFGWEVEMLWKCFACANAKSNTANQHNHTECTEKGLHSQNNSATDCSCKTCLCAALRLKNISG